MSFGNIDEILGELNVLFSASYDSSSSAPTTDMSIDFTGTEPPPINMPRVIPAPHISPAVSESHLASRVQPRVCYVILIDWFAYILNLESYWLTCLLCYVNYASLNLENG